MLRLTLHTACAARNCAPAVRLAAAPAAASASAASLIARRCLSSPASATPPPPPAAAAASAASVSSAAASAASAESSAPFTLSPTSPASTPGLAPNRRAAHASSLGLDLSNPQTRSDLTSKARYHRRARLWLTAVILAAAAVSTIVRHVRQEAEGERDVAEKTARVNELRAALEAATAARQQRREATRALLDSTSPPLAPAAVPSSFLAAVALDLRRSLGLAPSDDAMRVRPTLEKQKLVAEVKKKAAPVIA